MGRGGEVEFGGRRRRGLGSRPNTWVSFPWPREAGLASLIVWPKVPSVVVHERVDRCLPLPSGRNMASLTKTRNRSSLRTYVRHPLEGLGVSRLASPGCLRPTIDFVSLETVEKKAPRRQTTRALSVRGHGGGLPFCLQKRQPAAPSENGGRVTGVHPTLRHPTVLFGLGHLYRCRDPSKPHRQRQSCARHPGRLAVATV